jgi:hypothetical protein
VRAFVRALDRKQRDSRGFLRGAQTSPPIVSRPASRNLFFAYHAFAMVFPEEFHYGTSATPSGVVNIILGPVQVAMKHLRYELALSVYRTSRNLLLESAASLSRLQGEKPMAMENVKWKREGRTFRETHGNGKAIIEMRPRRTLRGRGVKRNQNRRPVAPVARQVPRRDEQQIGIEPGSFRSPGLVRYISR